MSSNIRPQEFATDVSKSLQGAFKIPNLTRQPFWKFAWQQQFVNRQFGFSMHFVGLAGVVAFFWVTGMFAPAPVERRDRYLMNGARFRLQTAYNNPGKRPAFKIAQEQGKIRYYYRGLDHAFSLNEQKDLLWKLRENWIIQRYPGIQYPNVARQMSPVGLPDVLHTTATIDPTEAGH